MINMLMKNKVKHECNLIPNKNNMVTAQIKIINHVIVAKSIFWCFILCLLLYCDLLFYLQLLCICINRQLYGEHVYRLVIYESFDKIDDNDVDTLSPNAWADQRSCQGDIIVINQLVITIISLPRNLQD